MSKFIHGHALIIINPQCACAMRVIIGTVLSCCLSVFVNDISEVTSFPHWKQAPKGSTCFITLNLPDFEKCPVSEKKQVKLGP